MQRFGWMLAGCALLMLGYFMGLHTDAIDASGTAIDPVNRAIVTSSADGRQVYVWEDATRFGGETATVRHYSFTEVGVFAQDFEIAKGDAQLQILQTQLDAAEEAMKALEETGEKDSEDYKALAVRRVEIAKEIADYLARKHPEKD